MQFAAMVGVIVGLATWPIGFAMTGFAMDALFVSAISPAAIAVGTFFIVKQRPEGFDKQAEELGSKFPWARRFIDQIRRQNHKALTKARAERRQKLIAETEAFRVELLEWLGIVEALPAPDDLEDFTLDELAALRSGEAYQEAEAAVARAKQLDALEKKMPAIEALFSDESQILTFTSKEYLQQYPKLEKHTQSRVNDFIRQHTGGTGIDTRNAVAAGVSIVSTGVSAYTAESARGGMHAGMNTLEYSRALTDIRGGERAILQSYYLLEAYGEIRSSELFALQAAIIFNDGTHMVVSAPGSNPENKHVSNGQHFAREAIAGHIGSCTSTLQHAIARLRSLEHTDDPAIAQLVKESFETGNSWATASDIQKSDVYKPYVEGTADLLLGWYEDEIPVGFGGYESLITIARPGTGKTQSQVIPNLLTYPGSVIALDVKGELYDATAATRAEKFGKVIKLDLRDLDQSHKYNPLTFCNRDKAWTEARFIADQLTGFSQDTQSNDSSAYFNGRARDTIQAFAAYLLMTEDKPSISSILDMLSPTRPEFISYLLDMRNAENKNLNRYANTLENLEDKQREAVFDTARGNLNIFEDEIIDQLTSDSDWRPKDLSQPGTTLYLCVPEGGIASYAALLRLIIGQHLDLFDAPEAGRPELPLTCFLDEFPQLGRCGPLEKATELGRGRGIRLWMFAQDHEQITDTYNQGIIDRCAIEMYMKPADKTAEHLSKILGETEDIFTGEKKQLAATHELLGEKFSYVVLVRASGAPPIKLKKRMSFESLS